jgi:hypothetical protein
MVLMISLLSTKKKKKALACPLLDSFFFGFLLLVVNSHACSICFIIVSLQALLFLFQFINVKVM